MKQHNACIIFFFFHMIRKIDFFQFILSINIYKRVVQEKSKTKSQVHI